MNDDEFFLNLSEFVSIVDEDGITRVVSKYALYRALLDRRLRARDGTVGQSERADEGPSARSQLEQHSASECAVESQTNRR